MKLKCILSTILISFVVLQTSVPATANSYYGSKSNTGGSVATVEDNDISSYSIFGEKDTAYPITGSQLQQFPNKCVAKLIITYKNDKVQHGTAFRYQTGVLATAGHCLDHSTFGKAKSIQIIFPSLTLKTTDQNATYNVPSQFSSSRDWRYDYGVIKLNTNSANYTTLKNSSVGWIGIDAAEATKTTVGTNVKILGYRANEDVLKYSINPITQRTTIDFSFRHDLLGGQSGSPIIQTVSPGYVVGLFNYGVNDWPDPEHVPESTSYNNSGVRVTSAIENYFYSFV